MPIREIAVDECMQWIVLCKKSRAVRVQLLARCYQGLFHQFVLDLKCE